MGRLTFGRPKGGPRELALAIALPIGVGALSAALTFSSMAQFAELNKPPLTPPGWLFPVMWTVLYALMGLSSFLIWRWRGRNRELRAIQKRALTIYASQLFFNFLWPVLFFLAKWYYVAFIWLVLLWLQIIALILHARRLDELAAVLLVPYLLWVTFAGYLNLGVAILN